MAALSVTATTSEAVVSCSSAASNVLQRIRAHASTMANSPKSRAISSAKAMNRSPSLAKRCRTMGARTEEAVVVVRATPGAGSVNPHSSRRCWLEGIAPPQRLQCFECVLIWLWQCGHSILCEGLTPSIDQEYPYMGGPPDDLRTAVKWPLYGRSSESKWSPDLLAFLCTNGARRVLVWRMASRNFLSVRAIFGERPQELDGALRSYLAGKLL